MLCSAQHPQVAFGRRAEGSSDQYSTPSILKVFKREIPATRICICMARPRCISSPRLLVPSCYASLLLLSFAASCTPFLVDGRNSSASLAEPDCIPHPWTQFSQDPLPFRKLSRLRLRSVLPWSINKASVTVHNHSMHWPIYRSQGLPLARRVIRPTQSVNRQPTLQF